MITMITPVIIEYSTARLNCKPNSWIIPAFGYTVIIIDENRNIIIPTIATIVIGVFITLSFITQRREKKKTMLLSSMAQ